jgi:hypothetical protein
MERKAATDLRDLLANEVLQALAALEKCPPLPFLALPAHVIGLSTSQEQIMTFLKQAPEATCRVVLLTGIGGSGKTTLAKAVLGELHKAAPTLPCHFLKITSELAGQKEKLHMNLLEGLTYVRGCVPEAALEALTRNLKGKKVLLLVDNAGKDQLRWLKPVVTVLGNDSVILVTSTDSSAADLHFPRCNVVRMKQLSEGEALELFCWHAFGSSSIPGDYQLSERKLQVARLVARCEGLPMALEVLGRYLSDMKGAGGLFFDNISKAVEQAYAEVKLDDKGDETFLDVLTAGWRALSLEQQNSLVDIVRGLKRQNWQLVDSHCGYAVLPTLKQQGLVQEARDEVGAGGLCVGVPQVIADFCIDQSHEAWEELRLDAGPHSLMVRCEPHLVCIHDVP